MFPVFWYFWFEKCNMKRAQDAHYGWLAMGMVQISAGLSAT